MTSWHEEETKVVTRGFTISSGAVVKTLVHFAMVAALGMAAWAIQSVAAHEGRIIRVETQQENTAQQFREIKGELVRINEKLDKWQDSRRNP